MFLHCADATEPVDEPGVIWRTDPDKKQVAFLAVGMTVDSAAEAGDRLFD